VAQVNVRELQNVVEAGQYILCDDDTFSVDETWLIKESPRRAAFTERIRSRRLRLDEDQEREMIEAGTGREQGPGAGLLAPPAS